MVLFSILKRRYVFIRLFGIAPLIALLIFGFVRFFMIFELPITRVISLVSILPALQLALRQQSGFLSFSYGNILVLAWILVSALLIVRLAINLAKQRACIARMECGDSEAAWQILRCIVGETKLKKKFDIIVSKDVEIPMMTGFFTPTILLPDNIPANYLKYILIHEWSHFLNHDNWTKLFIKLFCAVFWWNPLTYFLYSDIDYVLEIHCDATATKHMSRAEKLNYVEAAENVIKQVELSRIKIPVFASGITGARNSDKLEERFRLIFSEIRHPKKSALLIVASLACIFLFSYMFVIQPASYPPEESGFTQVDSTTAYIQIESDGAYALYIDSAFIRYLSKDELKIAPHNSLEIRK